MRRLNRRAREGEQTYEEIIERLLDETITEVELEEVIKTVIDHFDDVVYVRVDHPFPVENGSLLFITVSAGDIVDFEESVEVFGPEHRVVIDPENEFETLRLDFEIQVEPYLPSAIETRNVTPVYLEKQNGEHLDLDVGLERLRDKLLNPEEWDRSRTGTTAGEIQNEYK